MKQPLKPGKYETRTGNRLVELLDSEQVQKKAADGHTTITVTRWRGNLLNVNGTVSSEAHWEESQLQNTLAGYYVPSAAPGVANQFDLIRYLG